MHKPSKVAPLNGGTQKIYKFPNGYGASVVSHAYSYGGPSGLWELAVLGPDGHLTYDTPVTRDVIGWLDSAAVEALLDQIAALTPETIAAAKAERAAAERRERIAELRQELAELEGVTA